MSTSHQSPETEILNKTQVLARASQDMSLSLARMLSALQAVQTSEGLSAEQNLYLEKLDQLSQDLIQQCSVMPSIFAETAVDVQKNDTSAKDALILVVEDDPVVNHFIGVTLHNKYRVVSALDGQEAYEKAVELHPDVILTDIMMPRMRGDELMRAVRANPDLANIPIILITAHNEHEDRVRWLKEGAQDFLSKPVSYDELTARISNMVTVKRTRDLLQQELASQSQDMIALASELTTRKRQLESALNALQASESRFKRLARSNVIGVIVANHDGSITEANDAFLEMLGYSREELSAGKMNWVHLTPPEYTALDEQAKRELIQMGSCTPFEKEYIHKNGNRIPVFIGGILLDRDELSNICYVLDLSVTKRVQEAFRETDQKLQALIDASPLAIMVLDREGIVQLWSPAAEQSFGWSASEAIGKLLPTIPEVRLPEFYTNMERVLGGSNLNGLETRWKKKDGSLCEVSIWTGSLHDEKGSIRGILTIATDITERKRSEEALRFLIDGSHAFASTLDRATILQTIAQFTVPRLADQCIIHIHDENGASQSLTVDIDPEKENLLVEIVRRYPASRDGTFGMFHVMNTGESELYPEVTEEMLRTAAYNEEHLKMLRALGFKSYMVVPLKARERIIGTMSLIIWESDRRYTKEDLTLAEVWARRGALALDNARLYGEAQQAIRARDEFLSVAAHELKTPVTSLRGFSQLVTRQMRKSGTIDIEQLNRSMQVIDEQSVKLAQLVSQLLDITRIQAGRLTLDKKLTNVTSLVEGLAKTAQANTTNHTIAVHAPDDISLLADSIRLEQVISNLIDNAIKYSPDGGPVDIDLSTPDSLTVQIAVTDHGVGIPLEHRHRIFDHFYQAHHGAYGGMGLGLYISREIVELHNGKIELQFPAEGGTRFVVTLPRLES
jgi:PAS domain S-box-containing protein